MAEERAKAEWAIFEPRLLLALAKEANNIYSAALEGVLPMGGTVRLGSQIRALENNLQTTDKREWESYSGVTVTQPLLKNRGWESVSSQIRLAASDSAVALQDYRGQLALVLSESEMAYWELAAANALLELSKKSVETAEVILGDNNERFEADKTTELQGLQAEAGLALRKANLTESEQRQVDASARLAPFLGRRANNGPMVTPGEKLKTSIATIPATEALLERVQSHPAYLAQTERCNQVGIRLVCACGCDNRR